VKHMQFRLKSLLDCGLRLVRPVFALLLVGIVAASGWHANSRRSSAGVNEQEVLCEAARTGDLEEIERLVAGGADVNTVQRGTRLSPLMWAARGAA
jgi:hypothetical protein